MPELFGTIPKRTLPVQIRPMKSVLQSSYRRIVSFHQTEALHWNQFRSLLFTSLPQVYSAVRICTFLGCCFASFGNVTANTPCS